MSVDTIITLFLITLVMHAFADFVLQTDKIADMKQKKFWLEATDDKRYHNDWIPVLLLHSITWSVIIQIPISLVFGRFLWIVTIINICWHFAIDNFKCNKFKITLCEDQLFHLFQIIYMFICYLCKF